MKRAASGLALTDVVRLAMGRALAETHVAFPARVEAFDADAQTVDVRPQIDRAWETVEGETVKEELPIIASVPVVYPRARGFGLVFPIAIGDFVLVVVADRNIGEWFRTGTAGDARDVRTHRLDGAVAVPGLYPSDDALPAQLVGGVTLGQLNGDGMRLELTDTGILLGDSAAGGISVFISKSLDRITMSSGGVADFVALAGKVATELAAIKTTLDSLAGATFGTPYVPDIGGVGASKVKAE